VVRNGGDRRTQILRQAALTFLHNGYDATSMSQIAEGCGITKPGLYYHFKGKQDLLFAIMSHAMDLLEQRSLAAMLSRPACAASCTATSF
jgi:AcrR family transcriptional regulator